LQLHITFHNHNLVNELSNSNVGVDLEFGAWQRSRSHDDKGITLTGVVGNYGTTASFGNTNDLTLIMAHKLTTIDRHGGAVTYKTQRTQR
jgi:hypothetical protein